MKILHLHKAYLPPTQQWFYLMMKNLPEVENVIAAQHYLPYNFYDPEVPLIENPLDSLIQFNNQLDIRHPIALLQKLVIKSLPFVLGSQLRQIKKFVKEKQVDVIHAHFAPVAWHYRQLVNLPVPFVVSFYGYDYEQIPFVYPAYAKRYRWLFEKATAMICEGPHGAQILKKMGCPEAKIKVVPLGIEVPTQLSDGLSKAPGTLKLIQVASFAGKKGQLDALKAVALARENCPNIQLTLVGGAREPEYKAEALRLMDQLDLHPLVNIIDHLPYEQIPELLGAHHAFIHPSQYTATRDCEGGAPVILMDAMAAGLPVLSTQHCDIPFVVEDGVTGWLSKEKEVEGLARNIEKVYLMGEEELKAFGQNARKRVEEHFDIKRNAVRLKAVYSSLVSS